MMSGGRTSPRESSQDMKIRIGNTPGLKQIQRKIRLKRVRTFLERLKPELSWKVLDVGGTWPTWKFEGLERFRVTLLNLKPVKLPEHVSDRLVAVGGDATALEYGDGEFDLIFSNSVIEHVGTWENQKKFAKEVMRVGRNLWVQTPAREFFFEPHYLTPFIHWLPREHRGKFVRWFTVWGLGWRPTPEEVADRVAEIRLIDRAEMEELFEGCEILEEKFMGMTKSYIAIRREKEPAS